MNVAGDIGVFLADFGLPHTLVTRGPLPFVAITGHADRSELDGYVLGRQYTITCAASVGLTEGDHVQQHPATGPTSNWTVRDPRAVSDGLFCTATLEHRAP